jgi:hypothetical protein
MGHEMARTELWVTRGALGAIAGAQLLFGTPAAAGADGVNVTGESDCDTLDVLVSGLGSSSVGVSEGTNYSVADACTVTSSNGVETGTSTIAFSPAPSPTSSRRTRDRARRSPLGNGCGPIGRLVRRPALDATSATEAPPLAAPAGT